MNFHLPMSGTGFSTVLRVSCKARIPMNLQRMKAMSTSSLVLSFSVLQFQEASWVNFFSAIACIDDDDDDDDDGTC